MAPKVGIAKPPKRRRARMRVILPQPHMIFRFKKPEEEDYHHLDDDVDDHRLSLSEESDACSEIHPDQNLLNKNSATSSLGSKMASYFGCNLCFRSERQPVVTACGHLYCYSCLCDWLKFDRNCPVCEAKIVDGGIIPIYQCSGARPKTQLGK